MAAKRIANIAMWVGVVASVAVALLLGLARLGIWMEGAFLHPTPRINASTVGFGMAPVAAIAWIVYLWSRTRPKGFLDVIFRVVGSCVLLIGAVYSAFVAMIEALFVG